MRLKCLVASILLTLMLSGCYMFRKKNRCDDCPHWGENHVKKEQKG